MENLYKVCKLADLKEGKGLRVYINEDPVAVFLIGDRIYAIDNICPHQHSPVLHDGFLEGEYVICPAHGWSFSLKTGKQPDGKAGVRTHPVQVKEGNIYIEYLPKKVLW